MKIIDNIALDDIEKNYESIVAWGAGTLLKNSYVKNELKIDYLIDGTIKDGENIIVNNVRVFSPAVLKNINKKTLIIIFTIYEKEIEKQIKDLGINVDYVIYQKIKKSKEASIMKYNTFYSKNAEDVLIIKLIHDLDLKDIKYLDIGVCHPVMRNNTYSLYEMGYNGVLVEPNPDYVQLINQYRPNDKLLSAGVTNNENGSLEYYSFFRRDGFNTFVKENAQQKIDRGYEYNVIHIPVVNINRLIEENFETYPQILDIDTEGLDFDLIEALDSERFKINIIICETGENINELDKMMNQKNYRLYARTMENSIYFLK